MIRYNPLLIDNFMTTYRHIYREANMAADWLSKFGHSIVDTRSSTECGSIGLRAVVQDDRIGCTLVRRGT